MWPDRHQIVVCRMTLLVRKRKTAKAEQRVEWWKLKNEDCFEDFRERLRQTLGGGEELPYDWINTVICLQSTVIRETGRDLFSVPSIQRTDDKRTWCWNEEVQESIQKEDRKEVGAM